MPIKRRSAKVREHRITPEAIAAFKAGDWLGLHRALGLKPWEANPLDADPADPLPKRGPDWSASIEKAAELRKELEQAQSFAPHELAPHSPSVTHEGGENGNGDRNSGSH